jgi:hypothetical protein
LNPSTFNLEELQNMTRKPKPPAGCDDEKVVHRCVGFLPALKWAGRYGRTPQAIRDAGVDVMRVLPDGTFTTEI